MISNRDMDIGSVLLVGLVVVNEDLVAALDAEKKVFCMEAIVELPLWRRNGDAGS